MSTPITATLVNTLREKTGAGMMDCKKALVEASGNLDEAETILRKKGVASAAKKAGRAANQGLVESYIHLGGKIGVMVEVNCETDFVAKTDDFKAFCKDLCMQVAAQRPLYVAPENIPADVMARERDIQAAQVKGKPANIVDKIVEGKLKDFYKQVCLLEQPFIKDPSVTIREMVSALNAKLGENIVVRRFARLEVGEEV